MAEIILQIRADLENNSDKKSQISGQRFFKEKVKLYGVKTAVVTQIGKTYFSQIKANDKSEIYRLCQELWQSGYIEESFIACHWSYYLHNKYGEKDLGIFESWLQQYVNNWASCDTLCNHTIGTFTEMYPESISRLKTWTQSPNRWLKRASAVSLIIPAKKGLFLKDIFEISDLLLIDGDDLVQKGYGWLLKAASQSQLQLVFDYVMKHKNTMPRTALRYAIEKMPPKLKNEAMAK